MPRGEAATICKRSAQGFGLGAVQRVARFGPLGGEFNTPRCSGSGFLMRAHT